MRNTDSYWILRYNQIIHSVVKLCVCFKFFMKLILLLVYIQVFATKKICVDGTKNKDYIDTNDEEISKPNDIKQTQFSEPTNGNSENRRGSLLSEIIPDWPTLKPFQIPQKKKVTFEKYFIELLNGMSILTVKQHGILHGFPNYKIYSIWQMIIIKIPALRRRGTHSPP